jgi:NADPH:quinone reductase-like Zn-dependent oxidoreductase
MVEAVGDGVTRFQPGDEVFGIAKGSFAEYARASEDKLAPKPANLTFEQAAVVAISGLTALQGLRDHAHVCPGQKVLIVGASGGVGTYAVQVAKVFGAHVTGVCSTTKVDLVRSIGADQVVDYTREDFAANGRRYEVILDMSGDRRLRDLRRALAPDGTLVMVGGSGGRWFKGTDRFLTGLLLSVFTQQSLRPLIHADRGRDLAIVKELIEAGHVRPIVAATYPLSRVRDAIEHFENGHARGKVVIAV